LRAPPPQRR